MNQTVLEMTALSGNQTIGDIATMESDGLLHFTLRRDVNQHKQYEVTLII